MWSSNTLPDDLFLLIHNKNTPPQAVRVNPRRVWTYFCAATFCFFVFLLGTLLFFRELEINRKLLESLLEAENWKKTHELIPITPSEPARVVSTEETSAIAERISESTHPAITKTVVSVPRISDFLVDCHLEVCEVNLSLMPSQAGLSEGELLFVLETELPRIGSGNPTQQTRHRYFFYPNTTPRDELPQDLIPQLETKSFKFTRALRTTASFTMGKLMRPIAVNLYLMDRNHVIAQHERKVIEGEEP